MKTKLAVIISIFSILSPICAIIVMCFLEQEITEAILGGLLIGCLVGTVLGVASLILNRGKSKIVKVFSVIPMCPLAIYLLLLIPYLFYK